MFTHTPYPPSSPNSTRGLLGFLICASLLLAVFQSAAEPQPPSEYDVKAVFLFNFARFVEWPERKPVKPETALVIGILGEDPFGSAIERAVQDETIRDLPIIIRRSKRIEDLMDCHLLYINLPEPERVRPILESLKGRNILTIGEGEEFNRAGGIIAFLTRQKRIRIQINLKRAEQEGFHISAKLLKVADLFPRD